MLNDSELVPIYHYWFLGWYNLFQKSQSCTLSESWYVTITEESSRSVINICYWTTISCRFICEIVEFWTTAEVVFVWRNVLSRRPHWAIALQPRAHSPLLTFEKVCHCVRVLYFVRKSLLQDLSAAPSFIFNLPVWSTQYTIVQWLGIFYYYRKLTDSDITELPSL